MRTFLVMLGLIVSLSLTVVAQDHSNHDHSKEKMEMKKDSTHMMMKDSTKIMKNDSTKMHDEKHADMKPWNTMCPVMQEEVDPEVKTVEYNGKNYGFCCKSCIKKFKNDPAKYAAKLSEDGTKIIKK